MSKIKVYVRTRPTDSFAKDMLFFNQDNKTIRVQIDHGQSMVVNHKQKDWDFRVSKTLHNKSQASVYEDCARRAVAVALDGYNATILAYGQTGAGKSYTMYGANETFEHRGIVPRAVSQVFSFLNERDDREMSVSVSYMEIYNEQIRDLLVDENHAQDLPISEEANQTAVKGLTKRNVYNEAEALNLLFEGETNRAIAAHTMNMRSSRSHCIFTIYIDTRSRVDSDDQRTVSKLNFVDLAGSERLDKTHSEGRTQQEAMYINKSLTFLEQVVIAIGKRNREFVPYRQTKLTHFLKDSIGGNAHTCMIANVWGTAGQIEETLATLRFAQRMSCISNTPRLNLVDDEATVIRKQKEEIAMLMNELKMRDILSHKEPAIYAPFTYGQKVEVHGQVSKFVNGEIDSIPVTSVRQVNAVFSEFRSVINTMKNQGLGRIGDAAGSGSGAAGDAGKASAAQSAVTPANLGKAAVGDVSSSGFSVGPVDDGKTAVPRHHKAKGSTAKDAKDRTSPSSDPDADIKHKLTLLLEDPSVPPKSLFTDREFKSRIVVKELQKIVTDVGLTKKIAGDTKGSVPDAKEDKQSFLQGVLAQLEEVKDAQMTVQDFIAMVPLSPKKADYSMLSKDQAYEVFRQNGGKELSDALAHNKMSLKEKQLAARDFGIQINTHKLDIDKLVREMNHMNEFYDGNTDDGEVIIDAPVYERLKKVKAVKVEYRKKFNELKAVEGEVSYIEKLITACREKLLREFATWYEEVGGKDASEVSGIDSLLSSPTWQARSLEPPGFPTARPQMKKQGSKIMLRYINAPPKANATQEEVLFEGAKNATIRRTVDPHRKRRLSTVAPRLPTVDPASFSK